MARHPLRDSKQFFIPRTRSEIELNLETTLVRNKVNMKEVKESYVRNSLTKHFYIKIEPIPEFSKHLDFGTFKSSKNGSPADLVFVPY